MSDAVAPTPVRAKWTSVFLVCKACTKRGSGPKDKPKAVAATVYQASKRSGERARIVMTGCLGLCPKGATAIAHVGAGSAAQLVAVRSKKKTGDAVAALSAHVAPA